MPIKGSPMSVERTAYIGSVDLNIAWVQYGDEGKPAIIGLHGWLDNAATFDLVAPYLVDFCFYSIDLPGHGKSDHLPRAAAYSMLEYVSYIVEFADFLGLERFHLLGHSLGACIASLIAGALPERVLSLALIEGLGPLALPEDESVKQFQRYLEKRRKKLSGTMPAYESEGQAVAAREKGSKISHEGAKILAARGLKEIPKGFTWRSDIRLTQESAMRLTESQVSAFLQRVTCPTLLISGDSGFETGRFGYSHRLDKIDQLKHVRKPGDHHLHLDNPAPVGLELAEFFSLPFPTK
jgi:pimeloyl-ACP methyl ester carboxylesterase